MLKPKKEIPHFTHAAGVIIRQISHESSSAVEDPSQVEVLLAKRPSKGLLGGMWEFPNGRVNGEPVKELESVLETEYGLRVQAGEALGTVQHAYTHFRVTVHAFRCKLASMPGEGALQWVKLEEIENYPMGKVDRQIARVLDG